jgi:hypothetical protein|uniref:RING-type domain-containing protein n=1 Tax=viral metagenome TaxID=1070528 RepID=A0A6C0D067_9ZZZZ
MAVVPNVELMAIVVPNVELMANVVPIVVPNVEPNVVQDIVEPESDLDLFTYDFHHLLAKGNESHILWLLITCLMRNIVRRFDAVIFGGAVRDYIRHSWATREFYKVSNKYNDPIYPEFNDRFLIPKDIDLFITYPAFRTFKNYLSKRGFYYKEEKNFDLAYINPLLNQGDYKLIKAEIIYFDKVNKKTYPILLDIILCHTLAIPQMDTDFSVNKLLMTHEGIVSCSSEWKYAEIEKHIHNKEAFCNSTVSHKRYEKLNAKGWKVTMNYSTFIFKLRVNEEEETCVICLDTLKVGELEVLPKLCKCKYSYCKDCIKYTLKSSQCLMCKINMCANKKECDIKMYEKYHILNE